MARMISAYLPGGRACLRGKERHKGNAPYPTLSSQGREGTNGDVLRERDSAMRDPREVYLAESVGNLTHGRHASLVNPREVYLAESVGNLTHGRHASLASCGPAFRRANSNFRAYCIRME